MYLIVGCFFENLIVRGASSCDLWKVCNDDKLVFIRHLSHKRSDFACHFPRDSDVNFIKNNRREDGSVGKRRFQSQHQARNFAAGSHLFKRGWGDARVGGKEKTERVYAKSIHLLMRLNINNKLSIRHSQLCNVGKNQLLQGRYGLLAMLMQFLCQLLCFFFKLLTFLI